MEVREVQMSLRGAVSTVIRVALVDIEVLVAMVTQQLVKNYI